MHERFKMVLDKAIERLKQKSRTLRMKKGTENKSDPGHDQWQPFKGTSLLYDPVHVSRWRGLSRAFLIRFLTLFGRRGEEGFGQFVIARGDLDADGAEGVWGEGLAHGFIRNERVNPNDGEFTDDEVRFGNGRTGEQGDEVLLHFLRGRVAKFRRRCAGLRGPGLRCKRGGTFSRKCSGLRMPKFSGPALAADDGVVVIFQPAIIADLHGQTA